MNFVAGLEIIDDYQNYREIILTAVGENNLSVLDETNASLGAFLKDPTNQNTILWDVYQKAIGNVEDYIMDLPLEIRKSFVNDIVSDRAVSKILGQSDVIFFGLRKNLSPEEIAEYKKPCDEIKNLNVEIAETPIIGKAIAHDYRTCENRILKAVSEKDIEFLNAINTSLETYLQNELNQETLDWHAHQKSIKNLEEYLLDLTSEIRPSLSNLPALFLTVSKWALKKD